MWEYNDARSRAWTPLVFSTASTFAVDERQGYTGIGIIAPIRKFTFHDLTDEEEGSNVSVNRIRHIVKLAIGVGRNDGTSAPTPGRR